MIRCSSVNLLLNRAQCLTCKTDGSRSAATRNAADTLELRTASRAALHWRRFVVAVLSAPCSTLDLQLKALESAGGLLHVSTLKAGNSDIAVLAHFDQAFRKHQILHQQVQLFQANGTHSRSRSHRLTAGIGRVERSIRRNQERPYNISTFNLQREMCSAVLHQRVHNKLIVSIASGDCSGSCGDLAMLLYIYPDC